MFDEMLMIVLAVLCTASLAYALYVKVHEKSYTRERFLFAALSAIVSIGMSALHSVVNDIPIRLKQVAQLLREGGGHGRHRPARGRL